MSATTSTGGRSRSSGGGGGSDRNKDTTPIFTHSNYGNPAFTPQKVTKSSSSKNQSESRVPKPPKPPEKPILPYLRYSKRVWDSVKAQYPDLKLWELGKKIGAMWKQLSEDEKQEFIDEYEAEKVEYEKALKAYHQTPAYQAYMSAKSKVKTDADVHETPSRGGGAKSQHERRIDIQPAEDEDDQDEGYTIKHLAYARYLRNHRLINEIFSDAVVPDVRSVVTTQRMQVLKRQVSSLTMHQTKLEAELQQMEEKFEAKKQRMVESSEAFQEELKRHCKPAVDEETFQKMVHRMYDDMKRDRQRLEDPNNTGPTHASAAAASANAANRAIDDIKPPSQQPTAPSAASQDITAQPPALPDGISIVTAKEPVASGPSLVSTNKIPISAPTPAPTAVPKSPPPHDCSSKTDPEPMDIEPTPKPSVPPPPPPSVKLDKLDIPSLVPTGSAHSAPITMVPNTNDILAKETANQIKILQPGKLPTPTLPHGLNAPTPTQQGSLIVESVPTSVVGMRPTTATTPTPPLPAQTAQQQQQQTPGPQSVGPPTMPPMHPHHGPPPPGHPHMPPHMSHQPPPVMPGMASHTGYGNYGGPPHPPPPTGHTRSPYYQPQYGAHPTPQPYGQYAPPYSHYQQPYGPPPGSHYINARPPPQHNGGAPSVHYGGGSAAGPVGAPNEHPGGGGGVIGQSGASNNSANASSVSQQQQQVQSTPSVHSAGGGGTGIHDVAFGPSATHGGPPTSLIGSQATVGGSMPPGIGGPGPGHITQTTTVLSQTPQQQALNNPTGLGSGAPGLNVPSVSDMSSIGAGTSASAANNSKPDLDKHDAE